MSLLEDATQVIQEQYPYLIREYGVNRIGFFGSVAKQCDSEASDIDIVVDFKEPIGFKFIDFVDCLEILLERKVDVLTQDAIDTIRNKTVMNDIKRNIVYVKT